MTWTRHGECNQCGECCQTVAVMPVVRDPAHVADRAFYDARGFQEVSVSGELRLVLLAQLWAPCPKLRDGADCAVYDTRPRTCRNYPASPLDIVGKRCSYWFERDGQMVGGLASPYPASAATLIRAEA